MTDVAIASTALTNREAGEDLATQIDAALDGWPPDALIVFASPKNDYGALLRELQTRTRANAMVGCSSAGEFTTDSDGTGRTSAIALRSSGMRFSASLATSLSGDRSNAARDLVRGFHGQESPEYRYRTALVLVDALAGRAEDLVDRLTQETGGMYRFFGGGAGDDGKFQKTHVFFGAEAHTDAAVALEILSHRPIGIGARHGWTPVGDPLRVTEADQSTVVSLNVSPAVEAFEDHASSTEQQFDRNDPMPFFLHNVVGVKTATGHKLRVPLGVSESGGISFAAEVPAGSTAQIMSTERKSAAAAAGSAARDAMNQVKEAGGIPRAALFFDCVATRLRLGEGFDDELASVTNELGGAQFAGFNSYGQIVRAEGQFSGFHNCTAVVCVFPD